MKNEYKITKDLMKSWAKEYHLDGFRFDLMGLLTVELMNRIRKELDEEFGKGEKLLYGEPWRAAESPMEEGTLAALKDNLEYLDENIAVFSDDIRDVVKGDVCSVRMEKRRKLYYSEELFTDYQLCFCP